MAASWRYQTDTARSNAVNASGNETSLSALKEPVSPDSTKASQHRVRRRNRLIQSCLECRRRKLKCDKQAPCTNCTRFRRDCLYLAPALDPQSQQKLADIKEKMGALEKNLENEVASTASKQHLGGMNVTKSPPNGLNLGLAQSSGSDEDALPSDEDTLEPTPLASLDNAYDDAGDDELVDLGVQLGKMRISERLGGWIRPKLAEELNDTLQDVQAGKYRWPSSSTNNDLHQTRQAYQTRQAPGRLQASPKSYIGPSPDYIAPSSTFFFPGTNMNTMLMDYVPSRNVADQLISQYWAAVHYVTKIVHRPTFEAQYTLFWDMFSTGNDPVPAVQAVICSVMFSAAVSMNADQVLQRFGTTKPALIDSLRSGAELALAKANFLRTTRVDTMQAFVMYLIPIIKAEVSRAHSALVGTAVRLAECMGLHRDGSHYRMGAVEVHVRRMIWHQLCFLDMRTCEATGPGPQIRRDDYDAKFPLNVDDTDLLLPNPPKEDQPYFTDMTLMRIRAECNDMRRQIWFDIMLIDKRKKSLTSVLVKVQKFRTSLEAKFDPMLNDSIPIQAFTRHFMALATNGMYVQILHRYPFSKAQRMPDRLRQLLITSGLEQLRNAIALETKLELAAWAWYRGAFNQYHSAMLLMVEVYAYPMRRDAAEIWKCLDYIFDIPPHLSPKQKAELVITDLRDRMEVYQQMRKVRATTQMEDRVSSHSKSSIYDGNTILLDVMGQMPQDSAAVDAYSTLPPTDFSHPPQPAADTTSSDSRHGSDSTPPVDTRMTAVEDIDWAEWDKHFDPGLNTGELNNPDFNFADFAGGFSGSSMDRSAFFGSMNQVSNRGAESLQDLADVRFTPTFYPPQNFKNSSYQSYQ